MASYDDTACPTHADFDPLSPTFLAEPFAFLTSLQREAEWLVSNSRITRGCLNFVASKVGDALGIAEYDGKIDRLEFKVGQLPMEIDRKWALGTPSNGDSSYCNSIATGPKVSPPRDNANDDEAGRALGSCANVREAFGSFYRPDQLSGAISTSCPTTNTRHYFG